MFSRTVIISCFVLGCSLNSILGFIISGSGDLVEFSCPGRDISFTSDPDVDEDRSLTTLELIRKYGYPTEEHFVTTEDGYILGLHRIPKPGAEPVILMHGLTASSATFVMMGPEFGLAYYLYDKGFDIWMGNSRGNDYSRNHTDIDPSSAEFWQFSIDELGVYDQPAIIDYVLNETGNDQINYIGHSQGTTSFWIMCSQRPEYSDKIKLMQAMAPVAFLNRRNNPSLFLMATLGNPLVLSLNLLNIYTLPPETFVDFSFIPEILCNLNTINQGICAVLTQTLVGFDRCQINVTKVPIIQGHTPQTISTMQLQHFSQFIMSDRFQRFDYGRRENRRRYGSRTPPEYNLSHVKCEVALHYGESDQLTTPRDVERLANHLPNVVLKNFIDCPTWDHFDFIWGIEAVDILYGKIADLL